MAVFLITPLAQNYDKVVAAIRGHVTEAEFFELQNRAGILVSHKGTTVELSNLLGITTADKSQTEIGSAMVTLVTSYYGRGPTTMWEWVKTRIEGQ